MWFLAQAGGSDVKETTGNIMKQLMNTTVAVQFNWLGKGEKVSFKKSVLAGVVYGKSYI